jgi:hypothetical protein
MEMNHNSMDLMTKIHPDLVRRLGQKFKSSPIGKFATYVVKGVVNSNSLINTSCRRDTTYLWVVRMVS